MEEALTSLKIFLEHEGIDCHIPKGSGIFLKCTNYNFKNHVSMESFEFIQSYKKRTNFMSRCRMPELCERYKTDIGIYDPKSKRILLRNVKHRDICVHSQKKHLLCYLEEK